MEIPKPVSKQPIPPNAEKVFKGVMFDVWQWPQTAYDGSVCTFEKLSRADTALVIPVTADGKIILGRQEQPGKKPYLGFLGGRVDDDEDPLAAAQRELLEESGYQAADWSLLNAVQPFGKIEWSVYTFIARGCQQVAAQRLDGAEKIELLPVSFDEFVELATRDDLGVSEMKIKLLEAKLDPAKMAEIKTRFGL